MSSLMRTWLIWVAPLLLLAFSSAASAGTPQVSARASARRVEVGEPFTVTLTAVTDGDTTPSSPEFRPPAEFDTRGPSVAHQRQAQVDLSGMTVQVRLDATWQLVASKPGTFSLPGPAVFLGKQKVATAPIPIEIVPSSGGSRSQPQPQMPQSPFSGLPGFGIPFGLPDLPDSDPFDVPSDTKGELDMDTAPEDDVFVRTMVDKTSAVVGEQVIATFYLYSRVNLDLKEAPKAAPLTDFRHISLVTNPGTERRRVAVVGGQRYSVYQFDRVALFPLRTGALHTGSMSVNLVGGRRRNTPINRISNDVVIQVTEPPEKGRPPGYTVGDVGDFTLSATVEPKEIEQGGSISVLLRVSGEGNFPERLKLPERKGVEWLDPERKDAIEPITNQGRERLGGSRSFNYVVRISEAGELDLGKVELPFYNAGEKKYSVASAELGKIAVRKSSKPEPTAASSGDVSTEQPPPFTNLPGPRHNLSPFTVSEPTRWTHGLPFLGLLALPPMVAFGFLGGSAALRTFRKRKEQEEGSPYALLERALRDAEVACSRNDVRTFATSLERAVHAAIEAQSGVKSRGVLLSDLPSELEPRGISRPLGERLRVTLSDLESLAFSPTESAPTLRSVFESTQKLIREMEL